MAKKNAVTWVQRSTFTNINYIHRIQSVHSLIHFFASASQNICRKFKSREKHIHTCIVTRFVVWKRKRWDQMNTIRLYLPKNLPITREVWAKTFCYRFTLLNWIESTPRTCTCTDARTRTRTRTHIKRKWERKRKWEQNKTWKRFLIFVEFTFYF